MTYNPITLIDGYKVDHRRQYPVGTQHVYSNFTPRSSRVPGQEHVVFFGLQYFTKKYLEEEADVFFNQRRSFVAKQYEKRMAGYLGDFDFDVEHIMNLHELGYMPLKICALPEGTLTPLKVPMLTIENTIDEFFWLVNYYETILSSTLWLPCTTATTAYRFRSMLNNYFHKTNSGKYNNEVAYQGHDFSFRGLPGLEAAALSGAAHLLSFNGTDTIPALDFIDHYYPSHDGVLKWHGFSVPATEHSVMCAGGQENELDTFNRLLDLYPTGIVSVVSDTWDLWNVLDNILPSLKDKINSRDGKLVIRPDSGDPITIICGNANGENQSAVRGVVETLWDTFGGTINSKGYKELSTKVGVIYGDGITYGVAMEICNRLQTKGFASTNIVFGIGSFTYQYTTRDTYGFAMKATWVQINNKEYSIYKNPVTDNGMKKSATGRLAVHKNAEGKLYLIENATEADEGYSLLEPVWIEGHSTSNQSFEDVRSVLWSINNGA